MRLAFALTLLVAAPGCFGDQMTPGSTDDMMAGGPMDMAMQPPRDGAMGPRACQVEGDCVGACPPGSLGCTCASNPMGTKQCAPTCRTDSDCVVTPMGAATCQMGVCRPGAGDGGMMMPDGMMMPPPDGMMPPADGGMMPAPDGMMGPKSCNVEADCAGACPQGSKGCTCSTNPMGQKLCTPTCTMNADCPVPPMGGALTCRNGICAP